MSVGLLRVLVQSQTISNQQAEHYNSLLQSGKEILPDLFSDGIITPKALGELVARVFSYPLLDLHYYPRNNVVGDILTEEQWCKTVAFRFSNADARFISPYPIRLKSKTSKKSLFLQV